MVGKLLSLDLKDKGIAVGIVHPGFMRTEMTKGVGFDKFWDDGGGMDHVLFLLALPMMELMTGIFSCHSRRSRWIPH